MENLETLNLKELDAESERKIQGGWGWLGTVAAILAIGAAIDYGLGKALEGYNNPK